MKVNKNFIVLVLGIVLAFGTTRFILSPWKDFAALSGFMLIGLSVWFWEESDLVTSGIKQ